MAIPDIYLFKERKIFMSIISMLVTLVIVGVVLWLVNAYIPMDWKIKRILNFVVVLLVILWLLAGFGAFGTTPFSHVGRPRLWW